MKRNSSANILVRKRSVIVREAALDHSTNGIDVKSILAFALICVVLLLKAGPAAAQVGEPREELWIDGPAEDQPGSDAQWPDATVDHRGRQIFVWTARADLSGTEIFMRVIDPSNTSLVGPVLVNTTTENDQFLPRVAVATDGSFIVVWQTRERVSPEDDRDRIAVRSQAYDADGQAMNSEQLVSTLNSERSTDINADVAELTGGGYVAVWRSDVSLTDDSINIQARLIGANGLPDGAQFQVTDLDNGIREDHPAVTGLMDGGFFVSWSAPEIHGRRFTSNGAPVGGDFQINSYTSSFLRDETDVAVNYDGRILVVWTDGEESVNSTEIRGRLYNASLVAQGSDFRINSVVSDTQDWPRVGNYGEAGFFVVWQSTVSSGSDAEPESIEGRVVSGSNEFASSQFQVNQWTEGSQERPGISGKDGLIAAAWRSPTNPETSAEAILGQFWNVCGIFCNGFE